MMKKLMVVVMALSSFAASANMKSVTAYRFAGDTEFASFCQAVVTDDVVLLKRSIRAKVGDVASSSKEVLRKLISAEGVKCNNTNLVDFSTQREAKEVHAFLSQKN